MNIVPFLFIFVHRMPKSNNTVIQKAPRSLRTLCKQESIHNDEPLPSKRVRVSSAPPNSSNSIIETATVSRYKTNGDSSLKDDPSMGHKVDHHPMTESSSDLLWEFATHTDASFHDISPSLALEMKSRLLHWYRSHRRKLPWRGDALHLFDDTVSSNQTIPITGYSVWVSEIMLQQTRVEAVIPYYIRWMKSFPTVEALASATEEEINSHWAGLGYYRRAKFLHQGAKHVVHNLGGIVPTTVPELMKIPGIGKYTASAIASIVFKEHVPVVDGNVCRVFSRLRAIANHIQSPVLKDSNEGCWKLANTLFAQQSTMDDSVQCTDYTVNEAGDINQALMELGATLCAPIGSTGIEKDDPFRDFYWSTIIGQEIEKQMVESSSTSRTTSQKWDVNEFVSKARHVRTAKNAYCKLCDPDGVDQILYDIHQKLEDQRTVLMNAKARKNTENASASSIGHGAFPLVNPKKPKRDEVLAVSVLTHPVGTDMKWLMVRRPGKGLLAGQWEFPTVCLWSSEPVGSSKGTKNAEKSSSTLKYGVPFIATSERKKALDGLLRSITLNARNGMICSPDPDWLVAPRLAMNEEPLEHIFSHVRHVIWIEYHEVRTGEDKLINGKWSITDGREVKWMTEKDMEKVGITSCVKKILTLVKKSPNGPK